MGNGVAIGSWSGYNSKITVDGDAAVFAKASSSSFQPIGPENKTSLNKGVVFQGTTGTVYGSPTLPGDAEIPSGAILTVPDGSTLTLPNGITLTNKELLENYGKIIGAGAIQNNGVINDYSAGISATVNGGGIMNIGSQVAVTFQNSKNEQITEATYGDTIQITATAQRKTANTLFRSAADNQVEFYLGSAAPEHKLGEATAIISGNTATATLSLSGVDWDKGFASGANTILADFGGAASLNLLSGSGSAVLNVKKIPQPTPDSPASGVENSPGNSDGPITLADSYQLVGNTISLPLSLSHLKDLMDAGKNLTLSCDMASMTFKPAALKTILAAVPSTAGTVTFAATPADLRAFADAAAQIGSHPVYDFTITYKDGKGNTIMVNAGFPLGSAAITLACPLSAAETEGSLFMVCVDDKGNVTWLDKSSYDSGRMLADVPHFSVYGIAYKVPAVVFTDTAGHWAKNDIEFAAARGLLSATRNGMFSPDAAMTRGMFVTALGRLAGISPASYTTRSFTDVKADDYYAAYAEWAVQQNLLKGTGEGLFRPDAPVTREQMAVILSGYARQMGYSLPAVLGNTGFADSDKISTGAIKEVTAMQRAGIVKGKDGNRFDPQGNATRAEISIVLHRFVEIVIDPATANGWGKNDSGQWFYYRNGKALTGWQTIGKQNYYFNTDGVMHEGWKEGNTGKWYCWTIPGTAAGWREIDGKWYYFNEDGSMAVSTKVDGYEIGADGVRE